jgi:hypothetical protein
MVPIDRHHLPHVLLPGNMFILPDTSRFSPDFDVPDCRIILRIRARHHENSLTT